MNKLESDKIIYLFKYASPEFIYEWIRLKKKDDQAHISSEIELSILKKNSEIINLALAEFTENEDIALELFKSSKNELIHKLLLSGPSIGDGLLVYRSWPIESKIIDKLISVKKLDYLGCLLSNPKLSREILKDLFDKNGHFKNLDDESWIELLYHSFENPILQEKPDLSIYDGYGHYSHDQLFHSAWNLVITLPKTKESVKLISFMGNRLPKENMLDIDIALNRWKDVEKSLFVRFHIANLVPTYDNKFDSFVESNDEALKMSYFSRFRPKNSEQIAELYEQHGKLFLDNAIENKNILHSPENRSSIEKCCSDADNGKMFSSNLENLERNISWLDIETENDFDVTENETLLDSIEQKIDTKFDEYIEQLLKVEFPKNNSWIYFLFGFVAALLGFIFID